MCTPFLSPLCATKIFKYFAINTEMAILTYQRQALRFGNRLAHLPWCDVCQKEHMMLGSETSN